MKDSFHTIILALGSNVGDMEKNIRSARFFLEEKITEIRQASLYETKPWGYANQKNFLNTVLCGITDLHPQELLSFTKSIEQKVGRIKRFQNGPREIDIDIIFYDDRHFSSDTLVIPHPRMSLRDFVLVPMIELNAEFIHPKYNKTVKQLYQELDPLEHVVIKKLK